MFDSVRLDLGYDYGVVGGPSFSTVIQENGAGDRVRHCPSYQSKGRWNLGNRRITQEQMVLLRDFFSARKGRSRGFLWKDWTDYSVQLHHQHGRHPGEVAEIPGSSFTTTGFQLVKQYGALYKTGQSSVILGSYQRPIYAPIVSTLQIFAYVFGHPQPVRVLTPGINWQCSSTGCISIYLPELESYLVNFAATFSFDVPVRFDTDAFNANFLGQDIWELSTLNVSELVFEPEHAPSIINGISGNFSPISPYWRFPRAPRLGLYLCPWGQEPPTSYPSGGDLARCNEDRRSWWGTQWGDGGTLLFDTFEAGYVPNSLDSVQFATQISAIAAGLESQKERYSNGKRHIQIGNRTLTTDELAILLALFYGSRGGANLTKFRKNNELLQGWFPSTLNISFLHENLYQLESLWIEVL